MRATALLAALAALLLAACSNPPPGGPDAFAAADASSLPPADAATGGQADASLPLADAAEPPDAGAPAGPDASEPDAGPKAPALADFQSFVAEHVCGALMRCCDSASQALFFAPYAANDKLAATYAPQLPPNATLDLAQCRALLEEMNGLAVFADWVRHAQAGDVTYLPEGALACGDALDAAACGPEMEKALLDSTCFAYSPPHGGAEQRRAFTRFKKKGDACAQVADGLGGGFYGTCDPAVAFCCYPVDGQPAGFCGLPKAGLAGTCAAVAAEGETCEYGQLPFLLCQTGLSCGLTSGTCLAPGTAKLEIGAVCIDGELNETGVCDNGWCDSTGSKTCAPKKANGQACGSGEECITGACDPRGLNAVCSDPYLCVQ